MNLPVSEPQDEQPSDGSAAADAKARMIAPVQPGQRIQTIDILRGFAIFGILLVNMEFFNQSALNLVAQLNEPATALDQLARWFIAFFAEGKFYSTCSFLFGLGMAIQYGRAQERGARFCRLWLRRMLVLLGREPALCDTVREALEGRACSNEDCFHRLRSAGILTGEGPGEARPRCQLYAQYLKQHLA